MTRTTHFQIEATDAGWTARLVANGRTIFSSTRQNYADKRGAERACDIADPECRFPRVYIDGRSDG
jgi:uncharacterized protein YegP (UPF0339 family)